MDKTTTLNSAYFADDVPALQTSFAAGGSVVFAVTDSGGTQLATWEEDYYPDANGQITIRGIGEIGMTYLLVGSASASGWTYAPWVQVRVTVTYTPALSHETIAVFTTKIYYSRARTQISDPTAYTGFLSRFTERTIVPNQPLTFAYMELTAAPTLRYGVSWMTEDGVKYHAWDEAQTAGTAGTMKTFSMPLSDIASAVTTQSGETCTAGQILAVEVKLVRGGSVADSLKCYVDQGHQRQLTAFLFHNCFGVAESMAFTADDERTNELDSEMAFMGDDYRRSWSDLEEYHTVDSGSINEEEYQACVDLATSPFVYLLDEDGTAGEEVVITAVDYADTKPRVTPTRVRVTYRSTAKTTGKFDRAARVPVGVFDETFDESFE